MAKLFYCISVLGFILSPAKKSSYLLVGDTHAEIFFQPWAYIMWLITNSLGMHSSFHSRDSHSTFTSLTWAAYPHYLIQPWNVAASGGHCGSCLTMHRHAALQHEHGRLWTHSSFILYGRRRRLGEQSQETAWEHYHSCVNVFLIVS